jgi:hypothetical protein
LAALHEEEQRLAALEEGQGRISEQVRTSAYGLREAETRLGELQRDEPERRVYAYVTDAPVENGAEAGERVGRETARRAG